jgi:predicted double-glycine peptidase
MLVTVSRRRVGDHQERRRQVLVVAHEVRTTEVDLATKSIGNIRIWRPVFESVHTPLTK